MDGIKILKTWLPHLELNIPGVRQTSKVLALLGNERFASVAIYNYVDSMERDAVLPKIVFEQYQKLASDEFTDSIPDRLLAQIANQYPSEYTQTLSTFPKANRQMITQITSDVAIALIENKKPIFEILKLLVLNDRQALKNVYLTLGLSNVAWLPSREQLERGNQEEINTVLQVINDIDPTVNIKLTLMGIFYPFLLDHRY